MCYTFVLFLPCTLLFATTNYIAEGVLYFFNSELVGILITKFHMNIYHVFVAQIASSFPSSSDQR